LSFYDYRDAKSLFLDLDAVSHELNGICIRIDEMIEVLNRKTTTGAFVDSRQIVKVVKLAQQIIGRGIDPIKAFHAIDWKLEAPLRNYRDWAQKVNHRFPQESLDSVLIKVLSANPSSWTQFLELMKEEGAYGQPKARQEHSPTSKLISLLIRAGYSIEEMPEIGKKYLSGELILRMRISLPWQFIEVLLTIQIDQLLGLPNATKAILAEGLNSVVKILQL